MKLLLKYIFSLLIYYTGLVRLLEFYLSRKKIGHLVIFVGHRIIDDTDRFNGVNQMYIDWGHAILCSDFIHRLQYLKKRYCFVSPDEAIKKLKTGNLSERLVVLTFDDGYIDCKSTIIPIAKKLNVPVTFFLSSAFIGTNRVPWWDQIVHSLHDSKQRDLTVDSLAGLTLSLRKYGDKLLALRRLTDLIANTSEEVKHKICSEIQTKIGGTNVHPRNLYMTWDDIYSLAREPLCTIESHTVNHPNLCTMSEEKIRNEAINSKKILEKKIQKKVKYLAYPHGCYSRKVRDVVATSGYEATFAIENGRHDDSFALRRVNLCTNPFCVFAVESTGIIEYLKSKIGA